MHIYLASAILALWRWPKPLPMSNDGKKDKHEIAVPWHSNVGSLETLGDGLFGVSSVVDVCLQDSNVDKIYWWSVISSLLWMADALLYLRADFVGMTMRLYEPISTVALAARRPSFKPSWSWI